MVHSKAQNWFIFILLLFSMLCCKKLDSPIKSDQATFDSLLRVAHDSLNTNPEWSYQTLKEADQYVSDSIQYYEKLNYVTQYLISVGKLDSALRLSRQIIRFTASIKSLSFHDSARISSAYNNVALTYAMTHKTDSTLYYYQQAYKYIPDKKNNKWLPNIFINIADAYVHLSDYPNAIKSYLQVLVLSDSLKTDDDIIFAAYSGLGQAYLFGLQNYEAADDYLKKIELLYKDRSLNEKYFFCNTRGNFYFDKKEYTKALPWFIKARDIAESVKSQYHINLNNANLGGLYYELNELDSAQKYLDESYHYFQIDKSATVICYLTAYKARLALKQGNKQLAGEILKSFQEGEYVEPKITQEYYKSLQSYYAAIGDYSKALEFEIKERLLSDSIQSKYVKNTVAELGMQYSRDTTLIKKEFLIQAKDKEISNMKMITVGWVVFALGVLIALVFIVISRKKTLELQKIKQAEAIAKLRLQSLRNGISPHFIFNVLNREIYKSSDEEKHAELFALIKLLRRSLEITEQVAIPLSDELDFVRNYLKIEEQSFHGELQVNFQLDESIDLNTQFVLSMIIQIPVENALKHALRPKEGEKKLDIILKQLDHHDLFILVRDNGRGYRPEENVQTKGTGLGLKVLQQTIKLLNTKNEKQMELNIANRKDSEGTEVTIFIPAAYMFNV